MLARVLAPRGASQVCVSGVRGRGAHACFLELRTRVARSTRAPGLARVCLSTHARLGACDHACVHHACARGPEGLRVHIRLGVTRVRGVGFGVPRASVLHVKH